MNRQMYRIPCGYLLLNEQGMILESNEYFAELLNYEQEQISGLYMEHFLSSSSKIVFHSLFLMQMFSLGQLEEIYLTLKTKDGVDIPIQLNGKVTNLDDKKCIECAFVKITKRKQYEQELQLVRDELEKAYELKNQVLEKENRLRELFETILFSIHEGIIVTDDVGNIRFMNKLAEKYTGWTSQDATGKSFAEVFYTIEIQSRKQCEPIIGNKFIIKKGHDYIRDVILVSKDGRERYIQGTSAFLTKSEQVTGAVTTFRDITKEYLQESVIDSFLNVNMDILCVYDMDMSIHKVNHRFAEILGYPEEELLGKQFVEFIQESDILLIEAAINKMKDFQDVQEFTSKIQCKDGSYKFFEWRIQLSMGQYIFASARDVTSKTIENEQLINKALRDQLTGLYNRHYLNQKIYDEMNECDKAGQKLAMAIMDLDRFKLVNDTWGHPIGDELLKVTAQIATNNLRTSDWVIRFGGEEFVIILPQTSLEEAIIALEKVRVAFENNTHPVTGKQTLSIGVAEKKDEETFQLWYERVDGALYRAKTEGRNRIVSM
ncbi:sensor domain-containing diguanylate cyclase [Konateibacter massiliensis]|uniref:sensor domain-containing diguanylate cyclase n=1 Tax=Konateibacter massiliensis TaxID=2002841 RepID=UPI000C15CBB8|nr:diguanylate cyclase [Konateibacter massiliensis]